MQSFESLNEREILALAISLEEEDARIYDDFAHGLEESYPEQAKKFGSMRQDEDSHRHRLLNLCRERFGEHIPLIGRQEVKGFVKRRPIWLVRRGHPWGRGAVCGMMTAFGGLGHSLPYLIPNVRVATWIAVAVVIVELGVISWVRNRYMDTAWASAVVQVVLGGILVFLVGILIGSS